MTGSRFLIETGASRVLVDAGLHQGLRELRRRNWDDFPVDPSTLDGVVLTHAHLDHCGYLPRLVRGGLEAPVLCTAETVELAAIVLRDSAHLQEEEEAAYATDAGYSRHTTARPLYDTADVERTLPMLRRVPLHDDRGRPRRRDPPHRGARWHGAHPGIRHRPNRARAAARRRAHDPGLVPTVPVHVDSPMALKALDVYRRALADVDPRLLPRGWDARTFGVPDLHISGTASQSEALTEPRHPCVIISASGMATGGRVVHHLAHQLADPRNCVVLTGYQAVGTRGRDLVEGARQVKLHGRHVPVRAEIVEDTEFSVHADADEVLDWLSRCDPAPRTLYVVHGEPQAAQAVASRAADELGWCAVVPRHGERVRLD